MAEKSPYQPEQSVSAQRNTSLESRPSRQRFPHEAYTIGWVCALPKEQTAARAMLDEEHEPLPAPRNDHNSYTLGSMCGHNVVIACLPNMGTNPAATVATSMINTFQSIRFGFMVGIGGGIPPKVRLGDVVVSQPVGDYHGVIQWDVGKLERDGQFVHTGSLNRPPNALLNASNQLKSNHEMHGSKINKYLDVMEDRFPRLKPKYTRCEHLQDPLLVSERFRTPGKLRLLSILWEAIVTIITYFLGLWAIHPVNQENIQLSERSEGTSARREVQIHHGLIASGNKVVRDARFRDSLDKRFGGHLLCVEMEAAGLMNDFPCIAIRGICDYADSRKEKAWQEYAAAVAAAYAKELLGCLQPSAVIAESSARTILENVQQSTSAIKATVGSIKSDIHTTEIKCWLSPPDPSSNANHARNLRHEGTGAWLLETPVFQSWYSGSRQHIWLHGLAGCGKTVLSVAVLDYLTERDNTVLSFFFDFNDTTKQTLDGMLRSLVFQLYQGRVESTTHIDTLFQTHQNGSDQPAIKVLWDIIFRMLVDGKKVSIVLDALDESSTRADILRWITDIVSRPELGHVQLLYTARPESEFVRDMPALIGQENCLSINKQAVNADIRSWVRAQLSQRRDFKEKKLSDDLLKDIQTNIGNRADGMFRWAFCQLDSLARCRHQAAIEEALISLPLGLNETYQRLIESIPENLKDDATRLLHFLVYSKKPLKLSEAKEVIATQVENKPEGFDVKRRLFCETDVLDYCPSLVKVVQAADKELHLAHFSVKEYLVKQDQFKITTASMSIVRTCLTYLTDINGSHTEIKRDFPMARRAAEVWADHAVLAQTSEDIVRLTVRFLENEATFQRWARLYQPDKGRVTEPGPPGGSRLYYICFSGLVAPALALIGKGADVNARGGYYGNALQAASCKGHEKIVQMLLDHGAVINIQGGGYGNALQAASCKGHEKIVQMLLDHGAEIDMQCGGYGTALQAASFKGQEKIVQMLLDHGAEINMEAGLLGSALQAASNAGHEKIVQMLLDHGAEINMQCGGYGTALQAASYEGHEKVVQMLLDHGAEIEIYGGAYGDPFRAASFRRREKVIQILQAHAAKRRYRYYRLTP